MQMIIQVLLLMTLGTGTVCQIIVFNESELTSPCVNKSRGGVDTLVLTGTIGGNISSLLAQNWQPNIYIVLMRQGYTHHGTVCTFRIGGNTCASYPLYYCTCGYSPSGISFAINITLTVLDSQAVLHGVWRNNNVTTIYSNNHTLPEVCDVNSAHLTLAITGVTGSMSMQACVFALALPKGSLMELCCSSMAMPCYPQIAFRGAVLAKNKSPCVSYSPTSSQARGTVVLSYSVCTYTDYITGNSCTVWAGLATKSTAIPTTGVAITNTVSPITGVVTVQTKVPSTDSPSSWIYTSVYVAMFSVLVLITAVTIGSFIAQYVMATLKIAPAPVPSLAARSCTRIAGHRHDEDRIHRQHTVYVSIQCGDDDDDDSSVWLSVTTPSEIQGMIQTLSPRYCKHSD